MDNSSPQQPSKLDDAYWAALFKQEKKITEAGLPARNQLEPWPDDSAPFEDIPRWERVEDQMPDAWLLAAQLMENDETIELQASGFNKGGLLVHWKGLQGFVPASQLTNFPNFHLESERVKELQQRQHQRLRLKIIELNKVANRLILSERAARVKADERENLLHSLQAGDKRQGHVTNLTQFGAFIDLGGVEGLIHISELSWSRVDHPSNILRPGDTVDVLVLGVDQDKERIALSLKQMRRDPWLNIEARYQTGQLVEGIISNIVSFGAFAELEPGLEGLIHISELAEGSFLHPRNVVHKGERVVARVLQVDGINRRLALSLRAAQRNQPA